MNRRNLDFYFRRYNLQTNLYFDNLKKKSEKRLPDRTDLSLLMTLFTNIYL